MIRLVLHNLCKSVRLDLMVGSHRIKEFSFLIASKESIPHIGLNEPNSNNLKLSELSKYIVFAFTRLVALWQLGGNSSHRKLNKVT